MSQFDGGRNKERVHGGRYVRDQGQKESGHRKRLLRGRQQGHQIVRQVLGHSEIYDLQLNGYICVLFSLYLNRLIEFFF